MKRLPVVALALVIALSSFASDAAVRRWVEQVILGTEYGGDGRISARWVKRPTLTIVGGTESQIAVVQRRVSHINETLAKTPIKGIAIAEPDDPKADIRVYIAPVRTFPRIARRNGFTYVPGNLGYVWVFWNGRREIYRAVVLLPSDSAHRDYFRHLALEEITQSLGFMTDSAYFADSIFYANGEDGGDAEELSALDKALIVFFYNHVRPGANLTDVRRLFEKNWRQPS